VMRHHHRRASLYSRDAITGRQKLYKPDTPDRGLMSCLLVRLVTMKDRS
jgi:hypothetical protein